MDYLIERLLSISFVIFVALSRWWPWKDYKNPLRFVSFFFRTYWTRCVCAMCIRTVGVGKHFSWTQISSNICLLNQLNKIAFYYYLRFVVQSSSIELNQHALRLRSGGGNYHYERGKEMDTPAGDAQLFLGVLRSHISDCCLHRWELIMNQILLHAWN